MGFCCVQRLVKLRRPVRFSGDVPLSYVSAAFGRLGSVRFGFKSSVIGVVKDGGARYFSIGIVQCSCVHTGTV